MFFFYRYVSGPIKQPHPTHVSTRFLPINQTEAIDSPYEEERTTEEGKKKSINISKKFQQLWVYACS